MENRGLLFIPDIMTKTNLLTFLCIVMFQTLNAQVSLSLNGGLNLATAKFKLDGANPKISPYYFFGISAKYQTKSKFSFLTTLQYSQKGFDAGDGPYLAGSKLRYTYFDILPELEYAVSKNLGIGIGGNLGFLLRDEAKGGNSGWHSIRELKIISSFDYGILASVKAHLNALDLFVSYNLGIKDICEISFTDINGNSIESKQWNSNLQFGVGYRIYKGRLKGA